VPRPQVIVDGAVEGEAFGEADARHRIHSIGWRGAREYRRKDNTTSHPTRPLAAGGLCKSPPCRKIQKIKRSVIGTSRGGLRSGDGRWHARLSNMKRCRDELLDGVAGRSAGWERVWFTALAAIVIGYALLGSLHPVYGDDLFFLLNDARWLVEHHEIP